LKVADGGFFEIVPACVPSQLLAALLVHAYHVTGFVQQRVKRSVSAYENRVPDYAGFRFAPVCTSN
jgi:hypothetical protein